MKKLYSLMAALMFAVGFTNAQCTINPSAQTTPGANPTADNLPCVVRGTAYNQTVQGQVQAGQDTTIFGQQVHVQVDSVRIDSVTGLPVGIVFSKNPNVLAGGGNGCVNFAGTTSDPTGRYPITAWGTAWVRLQGNFPIIGAIDTPYTYTGQLNQFSPFGGYYLDVINTGGACHVTGLNDFNADLNAAFSVFPNPSTGRFEVKLNAGSRVNGEVVVVDLTGKKVFAQPLDVIGLYSTTIDLSAFAKGIYTVQLRTTEGLASKNISIE
jgi:hypothetical protein